MSEIHFRTCPLCEAMCGLRFEIDEGRIISIRGDSENSFSRGHICPKGPELKNLHEDPDRLKRPIKRVGDQWVPVTWVEALSDIARRVVEIQQRSGNDAVAFYAGNPTVHNYGSMLFGDRFSKALKTKNRFSATSVDQLPHQLLSYLMFGHQLMIPIPDIDHTNYFLIIGGNPFASNGSLMTVPDVKKRLKAIQERGGRYVVIDPRRTETAEHASEHVFIRPGTDAFLLLAFVNTLFQKNLIKKTGLYTEEDLSTLKTLAAEFPLDRVEKVTGVPAATIERLVDEFTQAKGAVCYGRVGVSMQAFGSICQWLINCINILTGNIDVRGGAMFTLPAVDMVDPNSAMGGARGSFNRYRSRVRALPEFSEELPVSVLAEEILTPGAGQVRALFTTAGNPVLSTPNGRQLEKAISQLDLMVSFDIYVNETTRHAHYILPPTSTLEHDHYDLIFNVFAVRNTAYYSRPIFEPEEGSLHDYEIFADLTKRIELVRSNKALPESLVKTRMTPAAFIDHALKAGPYGESGPRAMGMSLELLQKSPHGVDLGPLEPCLPARLCTDDKKIRLVPDELLADFDRLKKSFQAAALSQDASSQDASLLLIGRRHLRNNNSWMHNLPKLMAGKNRCTVMIHPDDAQALGIHEEDAVTVESDVATITLPAEISDGIMKGVVSIPHGFGHHRPGTALNVATKFPGASINDLTSDRQLDEFSGNAAFSAIKVRLSRSG